MSIKDKNDISYFKFLELSKVIDGNEEDERFVLEEAYKIFKPKNINRFAAALEKEGKLKRRFDLDLEFNAGRFIDADTFRADNDVLNMFKSLLKPKRKWYGVRYKIEDLSLREGEYLLQLWDDYLGDIKYRYEYIYNPPFRSSGNQSTQGSTERREFAEHYGGYAEMTYLIANGMVKDFKDVWLWDLDYFLFWGEYLLRKRDVQNLK